MTTKIPVDFLLKHGQLNWGDVDYGLRNDLLTAHDVIKLAESIAAESATPSDAEVELAGLLRDEAYRVREVLAALAAQGESEARHREKWLYLLLSWLYEQRESLPDVFDRVESIYTDFNYPDEMSCLVQYMPPTDGYRPQDHSRDENRERLFMLWDEFLRTHRPVS